MLNVYSYEGGMMSVVR